MELYGTLASLLAAITLVVSASTMGTAIAARFAAEFYAEGNLGRLRRLIDILSLVSGAVLALGVALSVVLSAYVGRFLHVQERTTMGIALVLMAIGIVLAILRGVQQGVHGFGPYATSNLLENFGKAVFGCVGIVLGSGLGGVLGLQLAASVTALAYTYANVRSYARVEPVRIGMGLTHVLRTTLGIAAVSVAMSMLIHIDVILAKHYLMPREAGLYAMAALPAWALATVMYFLPTLLLPKATAKAVAGESSRSLVLSNLAISAVLSVVVLVVFYAAPTTVVHLLGGAAFDGAVPLVFPFGIAAAIFGLTNIVATYRIGLGDYRAGVTLLLVACAEVVAIALHHRTAVDILQVLIAANIAAFCISLVRFPVRQQRFDQPIGDTSGLVIE